MERDLEVIFLKPKSAINIFIILQLPDVDLDPRVRSGSKQAKM